MGVFNLKEGDTRPVLQVVLHDPAPAGSAPSVLGPVHDLTGSTGWKLNIKLNDGTRLQRTMTKVGVDSDGTLSYTWIASDWGTKDGQAGTRTDPHLVGGLIAGPSLPLEVTDVEHTMEYEVLGAGDSRLTFPNNESRDDILRIEPDIGQA